MDDPYTRSVFLDQLELIAGRHFTFLGNRQIKPRPLAGEKSSDNVRSAKANTELVTRHPWLGDHYFSRPHSKSISDVRFRFPEARRRKVLAEHSPGEIDVRQLSLPKFIVLRWVKIDGLLGATMNRQVGLAITVEVQLT